MLKLQRILLPTDFSDASLQAGEYACELASRFGAAVDVLYVLESPAVAMPSPGAPLPEVLLAEWHRHGDSQLKEWMAAELGQLPRVERVLKEGTPYVEIVRYAKEQNADLIVLGTHGRSGLAHALLGSVAERVVRKAPCPVLTVRPAGHQFVMP